MWQVNCPQRLGIVDIYRPLCSVEKFCHRTGEA